MAPTPAALNVVRLGGVAVGGGCRGRCFVWPTSPFLPRVLLFVVDVLVCKAVLHISKAHTYPPSFSF